MKKIFKILISVIILGVLAGIIFFGLKNKADRGAVSSPIVEEKNSTPPKILEEDKAEIKNDPVSVAEKPERVLPDEVNLKVAFTSQAPHQNWDEPYQNFCEEASMLMAASYVKNQPIAGPDDADKKMRSIMEFENKKFGDYKDTTAEETAMVLREFFKISEAKVIYDPKISEVKNALASGKVIIVPLAGREIGNPNFTSPGPLYHMLLIKGYTKKGEFITNDPGTRKGADYIYREDIIMNAVHDWNEGEVERGKRVIIIVG